MLLSAVPYFVILSSLIHVFCCGIPLLLSITSLTTITSTAFVGIFETQWYESIEDYVILLSGALLAITFAINYFNKKINFIKDGACKHPPCSDQQNKSSYILKIAVALYAVNLLTMLLDTITA